MEAKVSSRDNLDRDSKNLETTGRSQSLATLGANAAVESQGPEDKNTELGKNRSGMGKVKNESVSHSAVFDSLRSHGLQPTRLPCPWNSPGKSTGVGCHCLLQGIFLTQGSNPGLLHCRQTFYHLSYQKVVYKSVAL